MHARTRIAAIVAAAAVAAGTLLPVAAADAAPRGNVLRATCSSSHRSTCIEPIRKGSHRITVRDAAGVRHSYRGAAAILRGLERYAAPCAEEDAPRCYWDASSRGNGAGWSFLVVGGRSGGEGRVHYVRAL